MNVPFTFALLSGASLLSIGTVLLLLMRFRNQLKTGVQVPGTLTSYETQPGSQGKVIYFPVFSFKTLTGQLITTQSMYGLAAPDIEEGSEVGIVYQPDEPTKAFLHGHNPASSAPLIILFTLLTYGVIVYYLYTQNPAFFRRLVSF